MPEFIKRNYVYVCDGFERECYHTETDKDEPNTNADRCVCCGEIIPEGCWVCPNCLVTVKNSGEEK